MSAATPQHSPDGAPQPSTDHDTPGQGAQSNSYAPSSNSRPTKPASCLACRQRKGRCDRQSPCSYCRRVNIACVYPTRRAPRGSLLPQGHPGRREADLLDRLRKLEGVVVKLRGAVDVNAGDATDSSVISQDIASTYTHAPQFQPGPTPGDLTHTSRSFGEAAFHKSTSNADDENLQGRFGRMVVNNEKGTTRYVSNAFWTKLNDELDAIRDETQELADENAQDSDLETSPLNSSPTFAHETQGGFIFGYSSSSVNLLNLRPLPAHIPLLWSIYEENVEPLVKILHMPTTHAILRTARDNHESLTPGQQALVFAIYHAAITSLEPKEVQSYFNIDKEKLLPRYRFAVEQALAKANFLNTTDITVVQAFGIFLTVVRRHDPSRFCWSLSALLIHMARGMGLHRDGSHFNLSPFETEVRRRIWWCLIILDVRCSEEQGTALMISEGSYDTKRPINIDDADISPSTIQLPQPREGRSDCTIACIRYEVCSFARRLADVLSAPNPEPTQVDDLGFSSKEAALIAAYHEIKEKFRKPILEETDDHYWIAVMLSRASIARLSFILYQPSFFPGASRTLPTDIHHEVYVSAMEMIEYSQVWEKYPRLSSFRWNFITWANWHSVIYLLVESSRRPWTPLSERAWIALNSHERSPIEMTRSTDHNAVFRPLRSLYMMAQKHRNAEFIRLRGDPEEARRLESEERKAYDKAEFGTKLSEYKMKSSTEKWYAIIQNGESLSPRPNPRDAPVQGVPSILEQSKSSTHISPTQPPLHGFQTSMHLDPIHELTQSGSNPVAQNRGFPDSNFSPLNALDRASRLNMDATTQPVVERNPLSTSTTFQQQILQAEAQQRPPPNQESQHSAVNSLPHWLRVDPSLLSNNSPLEDIDAVDMELFVEGFDWQNWHQNINEMGNNTSGPPWP